MADSPPRFLVIHVSRIGDTMFVTPSLRALAAAHPGCEITVLAHPNRYEVLRHLPHVKTVGAITKNRAPWRGWLGAKTYDCALVYGFDKPLVAYALRVAKQVVAFRQDDDRLDRRLAHCLPPPVSRADHPVTQLLALPAALGVAPVGKRLDYRVAPDETAWAREQLAARGIDGARPLIGLQVASFPTKAYRDWPIGHFIALCDRIAAAHPAVRFLIFGGTEERRRTEQLHAHLGARAALFAGQLTLRQTAALMSQTDLYIGVDTGPTHIMGCLDIPLVALYHGYSPSRLFGPFEHPCAYVIDHPQADACGPEAAMADIPVDRVWQAVARALTEHPPRPR